MKLGVILICLLSPLLILWLTYRYVALRRVGSIIIAYVIGCGLGLTGLIPDTEEMHAVQTGVASAAIPLAIPLLLFSSDLRSWMRLAPSFQVHILRTPRLCPCYRGGLPHLWYERPAVFC